MFCSNCGCRIPVNASKCPNCNAAIHEMEYCSGFWSELNQNSMLCIDNEQANTKSRTVIEHDQLQPSEVKDQKLRAESSLNVENKNKSSFIKNVVIAEGVIILVLLIYIIISGAVFKYRINELNEQYSILEEQYENMRR